jgi:cytochrome c-type biogenesis protein CcmH
MITAIVKHRAAALSIAVLIPALLLMVQPWRNDVSPFVTQADSGAAAGGAAQSGAVFLHELAAHLEKHPRDVRAWTLYARLQFGRGEYAEAGAAFANAVALPGKVARDPLVWCEYADALAMTNGGRLTGKPRDLIDHALALDGKNPRALEMAGSAEIEAGNFAAALGYWEELLAVLPPDAPVRRELQVAVERTRMRAGR